MLRARTLEDRHAAKAAVSEATRQLNLLVNQRERLTDMRMTGEIDADEFLARKTRMRDEEARLRLQLDVAERIAKRSPISRCGRLNSRKL